MIRTFYNVCEEIYKSFYPDLGSWDTEIEPFDHIAWAKYLNIQVKETPMPKELLNKLNQRCPIWLDHLVKETHLPCLIPSGMTVSQILHQCQNTTYNPIHEKPVEKAYWILITKKTIWDEAKRPPGYEHPSFLEAAIASFAAKTLAKTMLFYGRKQLTRVTEEHLGWPLSVGSEFWHPFTYSLDDSNGVNAYAGVLRYQ